MRSVQAQEVSFLFNYACMYITAETLWEDKA